MTKLLLFATTAMLTAVPAAAQTATHDMKAHTASAAMPTAAPEFVKMAGASDLYEKTSSKLVLETTKDPAIRSYANMMIADHGKTTAQVTAAAKAEGMKPGAPKLMPKQTKMIAELRAAKGPARDKVYVQQQVMAHEEALALHTTYSQGGDRPALKKVAAGAVPIVQAHLDQVRGMSTGR